MDIRYPPPFGMEDRTFTVAGFRCGKCGEWERLHRYVATDEHGERLYHWQCAPEPRWWWCGKCGRVLPGDGYLKPGGWTSPNIGRQRGLPPCDHGSTERTRACGQCGETFTPLRSDARYCSTRCRVAAHRETTRLAVD